MDGMYFIGTFIVIVLLVPIITVIRLSSIKLLSGELEPVATADIPEDQIDLLICAEKFISQQGFEKKLHVTRTPIIHGQPWGLYGAIYYHASSNTWALVYLEPLKNTIFDWKVIFITPTEQSKLVTECQGEISACLADIGYQLNNPVEYDPKKLWLSHQQFIESQARNNSVCHSIEEILESFEILLFKGLVVTKTVKANNDGFSLSLAACFKAVKNATRIKRELSSQKKRYENSYGKANLGMTTPASEYAAYKSFKNVQESNSIGGKSKIWLLLASIVLFGVSAGLINFSMQTLLLIILVLFVHELGHLIGMWLFGYRDLRMLFIPFLGALASGKKQNVTAFQEAVVLLLGPLPGYCLGLWILFSPSGENPEWLLQYALLSVVINGINMLPFMPLDGGRVVNLALFNRLPIAQLGFTVFSIAALGYAGIFWGERAGLVIAVILLFTLPQLKVEIALMRYLLKNRFHKQPYSTENLLAEIHKYKAWRDIPAQRKWLLLDSISYRVQHANAGLVTSIAIFVLWISTIIVPAGIALPQGTVENMAMLAFGRIPHKSLDDYIDEYNHADTDFDRLDKAIMITAIAKREKPEIAERYWNLAKEFVTNDTLTASEKADSFSRFSGICVDYEGSQCSEAYLLSAISLYKTEQDREFDSISLLLQLATMETVNAERALEYLNEAEELAATARTEESGYFTLQIYTTKADLLAEQQSYIEAEQLLNKALDVVRKDNLYMVSYIQSKLLGLYTLTHQYDLAFEQYQKWIDSNTINDNEQILLSNNVHYMMVMVLADANPRLAGEIISRVKAPRKIDRVEIQIAKAILDTAGSEENIKSFAQILSLAKDIDNPYEWYPLASRLGEDSRLPAIKGLEQTMLNNWYAKMHNWLEQPDHRDFLQLVQASSRKIAAAAAETKG